MITPDTVAESSGFLGISANFSSIRRSGLHAVHLRRHGPKGHPFIHMLVSCMMVCVMERLCGIICMQYSIVVRTRQESARDIMQAAAMPNRLEAEQNVPSRCSP